MADAKHLETLLRGTAAWNSWRSAAPRTRPDLARASLIGADFSGVNLRGADLSGSILTDANLAGADLQDAVLANADLRGACLADAHLINADLTRADLSEADLTSANFGGCVLREATLTRALLMCANLTGTDLRRARLAGANLSGSIVVETNLEGSTLDGCAVYGTSVWNARLTGASQLGLRVNRPDEPEITVDDLEVAQFLYLILNNAKLRSVLDTMSSKAVLILGRFTPQRKAILDLIHRELRGRGFLPILFDFAKPSTRSLTETVLTLASMARFVIADLTDAASVQQELSAIAYSALTSIPVQPIVVRGSPEWSMFVDLQDKATILDPYVYDNPESLIRDLGAHVIDPAEGAAALLYAERREREQRAARRIRESRSVSRV